MGYRSNGLWVIKGPVDVVIAAWIACKLKLQAPADEPNIWDEFTTFQKSSTGYIRLEYSDWKWYSSYPSIQFLEQVWSELSDNEELTGKRIRIGEDDNDVEQASFGEEPPDIYACSSISDDEHSEGEPLNNPQETTCSKSSKS